MIRDKIKTRGELADLCGQFREEGRIIGFTSGAFDLIHAGHVDYLEKAAEICDVLIVGVNTDESVRAYKGQDRPVNTEKHRIQVVAALASVDFAFLFAERRNHKNIDALKPHLYIKAGDYNAAALTSGKKVEEYGGEIRLIPVSEQISTTDLVRKLCGDSGSDKIIEEQNTVHIERIPFKKSPAVFLDRDGTINEEVLYLDDPVKFRLLPNALSGIRRFQDMGYRIVIISNQPGIGLGYYTKEAFYAVNREMLKAFSESGILVDKIYYCPHSKSEKCDCRKPGQALIKQAEAALNLDLSQSVFIGDKSSDMEAGKRAGMKTVLVRTGFRGEDGEYPGEPDLWAKDLMDAAEKVLNMERI